MAVEEFKREEEMRFARMEAKEREQQRQNLLSILRRNRASYTREEEELREQLRTFEVQAEFEAKKRGPYPTEVRFV